MALLKYTVMRLGLLVVTGGVLWLVGLRGWLLLLLAFLVSGVISIVVLNRARDEVSTSLATRQETIRRISSGQDEPDPEPDR